MPVDVDLNEHAHLRGLHIVVIDPATGNVKTAKSYDTYMSSDGILMYINDDYPKVKKGHLIVVTCKDDCVTGMSETVKNWFA